MSTEAKETLQISSKVSELAKQDILELQSKIAAFRAGMVDEEKFRAYRLARGVYGQRQEGVQMIRIKLPFGRVTPEQILKIADISDEYAHHNLHLTTRQDIQIHYVQMENAPKVWAALEEVGVTTREACGNTVRNITASSMAGIDPHEPFDVTPYAYEHFRHFLRNAICQEMGRKFKMAFSSSDQDSAFVFIHDLGFIPKIKIENGKEIRGFKVVVGGGLGAQAIHAHVAFEFLPEDQIIPYTEAVIRVFDRYGERSKRNKARMKFLIQNIGFEEFTRLVEQERTAIKTKSHFTDRNIVPEAKPSDEPFTIQAPADPKKYEAFLKTNVFEQKQKGFYGVNIKVFLGDMPTDTAREFAAIVKKYASDDIRITVNQGYTLRFVKKEALPALFNELDKVGLAQPGFDSTADITACPGTDTCNLGISSSTGLAGELERVIQEEYPDLIYNNDIKIKISGCMNACGQHTIANIGFHGMSIKKGINVMPAMQLLLGGGVGRNGEGQIADKVIKMPSRRAPQALRDLLEDYEKNALEGEYFNNYYRRQVEKDKLYFFNLLKPLAELISISDLDFVDWGHVDNYIKAIGVGECAGAMVDLVATLLLETEEKYSWAEKAFKRGAYADAIYHAYNTFISGAKAILTSEGVNCNTQIGIINDFNEHFITKGSFTVPEGDFSSHVLKMSRTEPTAEFAEQFIGEAKGFLEKVINYRKEQVAANKTA